MIKRWFHKIRFVSFNKKEPYFVLKSLLGFRPKNIHFYTLALLHSSSCVRNSQGQTINNERLEFLGDAILNAVVSDYLYQHFPNKKEGFLTNSRSKLVQREYLDQLAIQIGLDKLLLNYNKKFTEKKAIHIYGNAFEALIGAIYIDQGYDKCRSFIEKHILSTPANIDSIVKKEYNFKSKLIEWAQKRKYSIIFVLKNIEENKQNNTSTFCSTVIIESIQVAEGVGLSKKESQQQAAKNALIQLKNKQFTEKIEESYKNTQNRELQIEPNQMSNTNN